MVEGRSKQVFKTWLAERPQAWRDQLEVVAMDGFTGFGGEEHVEVEATRAIYQAMIAAYREPDRTKGRHLMTRLIASISHNVPAALSEVVTLGRTLTRCASDILAYFDRPGTSKGPTEAINGRLEHLQRAAAPPLELVEDPVGDPGDGVLRHAHP